MNFQVNDERLLRLKESKVFLNLSTSKKRKKAKEAEEEIKRGQKMQKAIFAVLSNLKSEIVIKNREKFIALLKKEFKKANLKVSRSLFKAILQSFSKRDETADVCKNSKGSPEPDPELRDYENVPLKEDITAYMKKEVLPHVPDAWIDESKTKVEYEINFNRYFYKYEPPRPLHKIETDLKKIEGEIANQLSEQLSQVVS